MTDTVIAADPAARWSRDFARTFRRQYTIGRDFAVPERHGWTRRRLAGLCVEHCPDMPVRALASANGRLTGILVGIAVDADGRVVEDSAVLPDGGLRAFERWLHGLAGRFVILASHGDQRRLYLDAASDMAAVFDPDTGRVASSLLLALTRGIERNPRIDWRAQIKAGLGYAFGHTPDARVRRAITNHWLDLDTMDQTRHWPLPAAGFEQADEGQVVHVVERIVSRLGTVVRALADAHDCAMPLTGGNDSRGLLACARAEGAGPMRHYTHVTNKMSAIDAIATRRMSFAAGVDHVVVSYRDPRCAAHLRGPGAKRAQWSFAHANGLQSFGPDARLRAVNLVVPAPEVTLRGNVMDMTRANQYPPGYDAASPQLDQAIARLRLCEDHAEGVRAWGDDYSAWLDTLPRGAHARFRDFAFVEQLLPNSTGGGFLLSMHRSFYMNPFNDRDLIGLAASFEPSVRKSGALNAALLATADASLARFPYTGQLKKRHEIHEEAARLCA